MPTALDVIQDGLENNGIFASGEIIGDADAERCLVVLNDMLDSWANESLICFALLEQSFTVVSNKSVYTIGLTGGADLAMQRPIRINEGPGAAYFQDSNQNNYPCEVKTRVSWNQIGSRTIGANIPSQMFYDPQFPLGVINLFPIPNGGLPLTCFFDSYQPISQFTNLATLVTFPPGYSLAIKKNFALFAGPYFKPDGWTPSPALAQQALDAKAAIKRSNTRNNTIVYDPELNARASATYNIYRDSY
jgi:hypothetical protein